MKQEWSSEWLRGERTMPSLSSWWQTPLNEEPCWEKKYQPRNETNLRVSWGIHRRFRRTISMALPRRKMKRQRLYSQLLKALIRESITANKRSAIQRSGGSEAFGRRLVKLPKTLFLLMQTMYYLLKLVGMISARKWRRSSLGRTLMRDWLR